MRDAGLFPAYYHYSTVHIPGSGGAFDVSPMSRNHVRKRVHFDLLEKNLWAQFAKSLAKHLHHDADGQNPNRSAAVVATSDVKANAVNPAFE